MLNKLNTFWIPLVADEFIQIEANTKIEEIEELLPWRKEDDDSQYTVNKVIKYFKNILKDKDISLSMRLSLRKRKEVKPLFKKMEKENGKGNIAVFPGTDEQVWIKCKLKNLERHINLDILEINISKKVSENVSKKESKESLKVIFDCYGFIFVDYKYNECLEQDENNKKHNCTYGLRSIYKELVDREGIFNLLTKKQKSLLKSTILNQNFSVEDFSDRNDYRKLNPKSFAKFIKTIAVDSRDYSHAIDESSEFNYINSNYGSTEESGRYADYSNEKIYDIPLIKDKADDAFGQIKDDIAFTQIEKNNPKKQNDTFSVDIIKISIQNRLESLAMERFLTVSTSSDYVEKIIKEINSVQEGLVDKLVFLTENSKSPNLSNSAKKVTSWREETIERYVELVVSEATSFTEIDKLLKSAYYYKIGNTTYFNTIKGAETVNKLAPYQYWISLLKNLDVNISSLKTILDLYHNKLMLSETHDINYRQANYNDNQLFDHSFKDKNDYSFDLSNETKTLITLVGAGLALLAVVISVIAFFPDKDFSALAKTMWLVSLTIAGGLAFWALIKRKFKSNSKWVNTPFNNISYRSKHSLAGKKPRKKDLLLKHDDGDSFVKNVKDILEKQFYSHKGMARLIPENLTSLYKMKFVSERETPLKRHVEISFTLSPNGEQSLEKGSLDEVFGASVSDSKKEKSTNIIGNIQKKAPKNIKIYPHVVIIYSFSLREDTKKVFSIYKDSVRVYFSLRYDENILGNQQKFQKKLNDLSVLFGELLYLVFLYPFHSELALFDEEQKMKKKAKEAKEAKEVKKVKKVKSDSSTQ